MANPAATMGAARSAVDQALAPSLRKLTVTVTIEAQTTDDSYLAPLVAEALHEFLESPAANGRDTEAGHGKFEAKNGLDVSWRVMNAYYEHGKLIGVRGVDSSGRPVDTTQGRV